MSRRRGEWWNNLKLDDQDQWLLMLGGWMAPPSPSGRYVKRRIILDGKRKIVSR